MVFLHKIWEQQKKLEKGFNLPWRLDGFSTYSRLCGGVNIVNSFNLPWRLDGFST